MLKPSQIGAHLMSQAAAAPGRVITLGVLGVVLLVVVGLQVFGGPASAGAAGAGGSTLTAQPVPETASPAVGTGLAVPEGRPPLPPLPLELARDLFAALPGAASSGSLPGIPPELQLLQANPPPLSDDNTVEPIDLRLQATYESTGNPPFLLAVIGGRVVRVGDRAGDWEVESIRSREVTIRSSDRSVVLKMP